MRGCFLWRNGVRLRVEIGYGVVVAVVPPVVLPNEVDSFSLDKDLCPSMDCWFVRGRDDKARIE